MGFIINPYMFGSIFLEFIDSAVSTASTITAPATILAGDLLVLQDRGDGGAVPTAVTPTGFTNFVNFNDGVNRRVMASLKIADGTEDGATITGMNGSAGNHKQILQFRSTGGRIITSATAQDIATQITDGDPSSQTANASGSSVPLIVVAGYGSNVSASGDISPRSFTPAKDGEVTSDVQSYIAYKIYNSSPADVTVDMEDEGGDNSLWSCYIECT